MKCPNAKEVQAEKVVLMLVLIDVLLRAKE